jgi:ParB-like chromosome segregation protein Spo0J
LKKCNATDSVILNIIENLQRENLEPMEAARSMRQVMDTTGLTQAQLAQKLGKSEPYVSQHLGLLKAAPEVQAAVEDGSLTATHVREMSTLPPEKQKEVLRAVEGKKAKGQKVSVSDVKVESDKVKRALGIKKERERKPKEGETAHDVEKIKIAKEAIGDRDVVIRSKRALLEQYGALYQRLNHSNVSEATVITTKAKISTIEYCLGIRDSL